MKMYCSLIAILLSLFAFSGSSVFMLENITTENQLKFFRNIYMCYNKAVSDNMKSPNEGYFPAFLYQGAHHFKIMAKALSKLRESGRQYIFVGDSVLKQQLVVFGCMVDPTISFGDCIIKMEAQQTTECRIEARNAKLHMFKIGKKFNDKARLRDTLQRISSLNGSLTSTVHLNNKDFILINQGLHHTTSSELEELKILACEVVDVYRNAVKSLRPEQMPKFIWQETTPQHYPTCNGWFDPVRASALHKAQCVTNLTKAMEQRTVEGDTQCTAATARNDVTIPIVESAGIITNRVYDPLRDPGVNFHLLSTKHKDCTHFQVPALILMNQLLLSSMVGDDF